MDNKESLERQQYIDHLRKCLVGAIKALPPEQQEEAVSAIVHQLVEIPPYPRTTGWAYREVAQSMGYNKVDAATTRIPFPEASNALEYNLGFPSTKTIGEY